MARAELSTSSWLTASPQQFQLLQPIGGVSAMRSPTTMRNFFVDSPRAFFARSVTVCSPAVARLPVMRPVAASSVSPAGSPSTAKVIGRWPVAGIE